MKHTFASVCLFVLCLAVVKSQSCTPTGCSRELCASEIRVSPCLYRDYFACYRNSSCSSSLSGICSWQETDDFKQCLSNNGIALQQLGGRCDVNSHPPLVCDEGLSCNVTSQTCMTTVAAVPPSPTPTPTPAQCSKNSDCPRGSSCRGSLCSSMCGGIAGFSCPEGFMCALSGSYPDASGVCVVQQAPTCMATGCSKELCSNESRISPCWYTEYFACYRNSSCSASNAGTCSWQETDNFKQCLSDNGIALQSLGARCNSNAQPPLVCDFDLSCDVHSEVCVDVTGTGSNPGLVSAAMPTVPTSLLLACLFLLQLLAAVLVGISY